MTKNKLVQKRSKIVTTKKTIAFFMMACLVFTGMPNINTFVADASTNASVVIWSKDKKERPRYRSVLVNNSSSELKVKAKGTKVDSVKWSSTNTDIVQITKESKTGCTFKGITEGVAKVKMTAETSNGTFKDSVLISVRTKVTTANAKRKNATTVFRRGADKSAKSRGKAKKGLKLTVLGKCGNYYLVKPPKTFKYKEKTIVKGKNSFIPKSAITVFANSVTLDKKTLAPGVGEKKAIKATVSPSFANNKKVTWKSSNTTIATVSSTGNVTGKAYGTVTITATTADGTNKKATCKVTVPKIRVTSVSLNKNNMELLGISSEKLTATVSPSNASTKVVTWKTSDPKVAVVDGKGLVTGTGVGTAIITVTTDDGDKTDTCTVTVLPVPLTGISLDEKELKIARGKTGTLTPIYEPPNATDRAVTWESSNIDVATVENINNKGKVKGEKEGTATITVIANVGGFTDSCEVIVRLPAPKISSISAAKKNDKVKVTLSWGKVSGANGYNVFRATSEKGTYTQLNKSKITDTTFTETAPGYKIYWYKVQAVGSAAKYNSDLSNPKSVNTLLRPTGLSPTTDGKAVTLKWDKTIGAKEYEIHWHNSSTKTYKLLDTTKKLKYIHSGATKDKYNYYKVRAVNSAGKSAFSGAVSLLHASKFAWPVPGYTKIADNGDYGDRICPIHGPEFHKGIDIPAPAGKPVVAAQGGSVNYISYSTTGLGTHIVLSHSNNIYTLYGHNSSLVVTSGTVNRGNTIAKIGTTGSSTGNHCHFEVRKPSSASGNHTNPWPYLK